MARSHTKARFTDPMLLLRTDRLPEGATWQFEIKLDGYRAIAFKSGGRVQLRSRNDKDFGGKYPTIVKALSAMPDETVIDGEVVALDPAGRPSFNALQNYGSSAIPLFYYVFDVLILAGEDITSEPLARRRERLQTQVLSKLDEPIRESPTLDASLPDLIRSVKAQGLEGIVAKRLDSRYEPGLRSGMWQKMRVQPGTGVRDRRIHGQCKELRRPDIRVLQGHPTHLRGPNAEWFYTGITGETVPAIQGNGDQPVPVCKSSRG